MKKQKTPDVYDVLIVGGGLVGASLAVALKPLALNVALVDAFQAKDQQHPAYDDRAIALSYGSQLIYQGMGIWSDIQTDATAIKTIHISDQGHFGATRLSAQQENIEALGYLVESRRLGQQLYQALSDQRIDRYMPARVETITHHTDFLEVTLEQAGKTKTLRCQLLVAADGTRSSLRELAAIGVQHTDYHQVGVVANVSTEKAHQNQAFERFTSKGPIALLPLSNQRSSLIWTQPSNEAAAILALEDTHFLQQLGNAFGYRLGRFTKVGKRSAFPLSLVTADRNTAERIVLIGNASHTLHPVAGQGLNLALRDVAVLADLLAQQRQPLAVSALLLDYEQQRQQDLKETIRYTDGLVRLFSNPNVFLGHLRAGGLIMVDRISPLRKRLTRQSMGTQYRQSRLSRGLTLSTTTG
ncbi:MAG: 2-octaprenyl-6-methoxyphenyl hydroxylase [Cocleimonas sp.]|nr:2-octaprenyl-6-methoxyphenyl hydroxylase [Cocleimonas sp.]